MEPIEVTLKGGRVRVGYAATPHSDHWVAPGLFRLLLEAHQEGGEKQLAGQVLLCQVFGEGGYSVRQVKLANEAVRQYLKNGPKVVADYLDSVSGVIYDHDATNGNQLVA